MDSLVFGPSGGAKGVWETHVYDADGRQTRRIRRTAASTLFDESFWFDAEGRPTKVGRYTAANGAPMDTTYLTYAGLGAVQSRERIDQNGNWESEEYRVDGIGNVRQSRNGSSLTGGPQDPRATQYGFRGDLQSRLTTDTTQEHEWFYQWFDGDGNVVQRIDLVRNSTSHAYTSDVQSRSYYDAANRLRATQVYNEVGSSSSGTFDEMFYDALGRRVVTSSRRNLDVPACTGITFCIRPLCNTSDCGSTLTFTVWDGSQVLAEDRKDLGGGSSSYDIGIVTYVHGGGMDQPVAVLDSRVAGGMRVPHQTWRGQYESSSTPSGAAADCSLGGGTCEYIRWNATGAIYARPIPGPLAGGYSYTFAGTLLLDQQDASGLLYRRNRYYDPSSGRFTQEDPAGLAGGLNSYGFAGGDPVSYSDPFGLCKKPNGEEGTEEECRQQLTDAQDKAMADPKFQPQGHVTHCNQATYCVASAMGQTDGLADDDGHALLADVMRANMADPSNGYSAVSAEQAQALANKGELVIVAGPGHVATVRPDVDPSKKYAGSGPLIANVGKHNGVMRLSRVFTVADRQKVKFYVPNP